MLVLAASDRIMHRLRPHADGLSGWIAWSGQGAAQLKFGSGDEEWTAEATPTVHPLAGEAYGIAEIEADGVTTLKDGRDDRSCSARLGRDGAGPPQAGAKRGRPYCHRAGL